MKKSLLNLVAFGALLVTISSTARAETYGLFVGVADYPEIVNSVGKTESNDLKGPVNDVAKAKAVYTNQLGVSATNISSLTNSQATGAKFIDSLKLVLGKLKPGDTFVFYFSGHGVTMKPPAGSVKPVQALVLHDFSVIDNQSLGDLRKTLVTAGIKTVFILDSCFSGGMDRPLPGISLNGKLYSQKTRLLTSKVLPKNKKVKTVNANSVAKSLKGKFTVKSKQINEAPSILFLASQADQTSIDLSFKDEQREARGLFSLLLFAVLEEVPTATVSELIDAVETVLKENDLISRQRPRLVVYGSANKNMTLKAN